jgi:hypothetical protein
LDLSKRKRLATGQSSIFGTGRANLVFDLIEFGLQFVEFFFQVRRLLLILVLGEVDTHQLLSDVLLGVEIRLPLFEQLGRHSLGNLPISFSEQIKQRSRARLFSYLQSFAGVLQRLSAQCRARRRAEYRHFG